jgi:hypothetical protein
VGPLTIAYATWVRRVLLGVLSREPGSRVLISLPPRSVLHAASAPLQSGRQVLTYPALQVALIVRAKLRYARQAGALVPVLEVATVGPVEHGVARRPAADHVPSLVALYLSDGFVSGVKRLLMMN